MSRLLEASDALDKGYISKEEYAKIALDEGAITQDEYATIVPQAQPATPLTTRLSDVASAAAGQIKGAAKAVGEVVRRPFETFRAQASEVVPKIAETRIPLLAEAQERKEQAFGDAAEQMFADVDNPVTQALRLRLARYGIEPETVVGTGMAAAELATGFPRTIGEATVMAALPVAAKGAAVLGNRVPVLGAEIPELSQIPNAIRRALGRPEVAEVIPSGRTPFTETVPPAEPAAPVAQAAIPGPAPRPALQSPAPRASLPLQQPVRGEGFEIVPEAPRRVFQPALGEVDVMAQPSDPLAAVARRLGLPEPPAAPPPRGRKAKPAPDPSAPTPEVVQPQAPKLTKKAAKDLAADPEAVKDPAKVDQIVALVKEGKASEAQIKRWTTDLNLQYQRAARRKDGGARQVYRSALERLGIKPIEPVEDLPPLPTQSVKAQMQQAAEPRPAAPQAPDLAAQAGKPLWKMTPEEFRKQFPEADPSAHKEAVRAALDTEEVPLEVAESYPDLIQEVQSRLEANAAKEIAAARGGQPTPVLSLIRKRGLDPDKFKAAAELGEVENLKGKPVYWRKGGLGPDELAEAAYTEGLIPDYDKNFAYEALNHEITKGAPRWEPGLTHDTSFVDRAGQGGFVRPPGTAASSDSPDVRAYKSRIRKFEPEKRTLKQTAEELFTQVIDKNNPIYNLAELAKGQPRDKVRWTAARYMGTGGTAEQWLINRTTRLKPDGTVEITGEGLQPIVREVVQRLGPDAFEDLKAYMLAQRDIEIKLNRDIRGLDPEKAPAVVRDLDAKYGGKLEPYANRVRAWTRRAILDTLLDAGVLDKAAVDRITRLNRNYIPYDRVIDSLDPEGAARFAPGSPIKPLKGSERDVYDPFPRLIALAYRTAEFADRNRVLRAVIDLKDANPKLAGIITEAKGSGGNARRVFIDGKKRYFTVPPDVASALDNLQTPAMDLVTKILAFPATIQRAGVTQHPQFSLIRNPIRDQLTAAIHSKYGYVPAVDFARGLFHALRRSDLYEEYIASGGANAAMVGMDRQNAAVTLRKLAGLRELDSVNPINWLQQLSHMGEVGTRMGVFARARAKGASPLEAMFESKEATVNFGIKPASQAIRFLNSITAFQRPAVLSAARFFRAYKEAPGRTTMRAASLVTLPSLALWYLNKDDKEYNEIPLWRRNLFWHVKPMRFLPPEAREKLSKTELAFLDSYIEIPKPFEYGILFGSSVERLLEWAQKKDPKAVEALGKSVLDAFSPPIVPTNISPLISARANFNPFTGRPIVPKSRAHLLPADQFGEYTTETAKAIGRRLNYAPSKIDFLAQGYAGTAGRLAFQVSDAIMRRLGGPTSPRPQVPLADSLVARKPIGSQSESVNRFYDILDQLEREHASANERLGLPGARMPTPPLLEHLRQANEEIHKLREMNKAVVNVSTAPDEERRRVIDQNNLAITTIAQNALQAARNPGLSDPGADIEHLFRANQVQRGMDELRSLPIEEQAALLQKWNKSEAGQAILGQIFAERRRRGED